MEAVVVGESAPLEMAAPEETQQPLVGTLGMFIIDTFRFIDPATGQDLGDGGRGEAIGGGGTYFAVGARMWLDPAAIAMVIDRGIDFEKGHQQTLDHFACTLNNTPRLESRQGPPMWKWRDRAGDRTTKAVNVYNGQQRGFEYLTPKLRLEPVDLADVQGRLPEWVHCICSPDRALEICEYIDQLDRKVFGKERQTKVCWEPIPDSATPENLPQCLRAMGRIDVLSPNHEEAATFLSIEAGEVVVPSDGVSADQSEQCRRRHLDLLAHGFAQHFKAEGMEVQCPLIVIRGGAAGSVALDMTGNNACEASIPAWHGPEEVSKVVDVTGGGNSFLGGFVAALASSRVPRPDETDDRRRWLRAALCQGAISAAITIEQLGLPSLKHGLQETWNGQTIDQRLQRYEQSSEQTAKRERQGVRDDLGKKQKLNHDIESTLQAPSEVPRGVAAAKVIPGEWLCHVYIAIPLADHSRLAKIIRKAYKLLRKSREAVASTASTSKELVWLPEPKDNGAETAGSKDDSDRSSAEGELHISLSQPICVRPHEREDFTLEMAALLSRPPYCQPFALSFAGFTPLSSMTSSIYPPRIYHTLQVGQGHTELHALTARMDQVVRRRFQGRTYFREAPRFHASFAFDQFAHDRRGEKGEHQSEDGDSSPTFDFMGEVDEEMRVAHHTHRELEEMLGETLRTKAGGAIQVQTVCIKVGNRVTRVSLRSATGQ